MTIYDCAIIGGGPAGITAGIYAKRNLLKTVIFEKNKLGGTVLITQKIQNWPGENLISGKELATKFKNHLNEFKPEILFQEVQEIFLQDKLFKIITDKQEYFSKTIIYSTGAKYKRGEIKGETEFLGKGVSTCLSCDAFFYKDLVVSVFLNKKDIKKTCDILKKYARQINIFCEDKIDENNEENIIIYDESKIIEIAGKKTIEKIIFKKNNDIKEIKTDGLFILSGKIEGMNAINSLFLNLNKKGLIVVDDQMKTNIPGFFAAGDNTGVFPQISVAVGQGAIASNSALKYLKKLS